MKLLLKTNAALATTLITMACSTPAQAFTQNATLGEPFLHAYATTQNGAYSPALAIDGSYTGASRWQANNNSAITLDVGTIVDMKGIYLWLLASSARHHWIRVESSQDSQNWISHWHAINTPKNPNSKPVFLPLVTTDRNARYIRITGFGNSVSTKNTITEVRWLAADSQVSSDPHIKQAYWYNNRPDPSTVNPSAKYFAPQLTSWSDGPTNILSATSLNTALPNSPFVNCPLNGLSIFNPQYVVSDMTGHMTQFLTTKELPDGSSAWILDWDHVDLSKPDNWNGDVDELVYPQEMETVYGQWRQKYNAQGTTDPISHTSDQCGIDVYRFGASYSNRPAFAKYLANVENGSYQSDIAENWNKALVAELDSANNFSEAVDIGQPFETKDFYIEEGPSKATDGYIDSGSRWSTDFTADWPSNPSTVFTTAPSVTSKPKAHGLYLWMHRSNERWAKVSIEARGDSKPWVPIAPTLTLPSVPTQTPVYIPLPLGDTHDFKHFRVTGQGSQGTNWTSVAEIRYSGTEQPHPSAVVVQPAQTTPHAIAGNSFDQAVSVGYGPQTNDPSDAIDGSIAALNYWAMHGPTELRLSNNTPQVISAINLWMHRSSERSSTIDIRMKDSTAYYSYKELNNVSIPVTPNNQATRIEFDPPVLSDEITLLFNGNSNNDWNSVTEVSWE